MFECFYLLRNPELFAANVSARASGSSWRSRSLLAEAARAARVRPLNCWVVSVLGLRHLLPWSDGGQVVEDDLAVITVGSVG
ncbi:hypothetical protein A2J03_28835 [Rhodococcus sp. EPR-157]|nr:hypothetical protein A2J03_28835 [Rhodococcus sp. EPR-157]